MSFFGKLYKISTFGESHGKAVGVTIEGVPSNMKLDLARVQRALNRRRPGQSTISTDRNEEDKLEVLCGLEDGVTLGYPITIIVNNKDMRKGDYKFNPSKFIPRPSHADFTYYSKYGIHASSGGGRSSARETIGRVIAGAIAEQVLWERYGISIVAWVKQVGGYKYEMPYDEYSLVTREMVDSNIVRCPNEEVGKKMIDYISKLKSEGDSTGGLITCVVKNMMSGIGEPVFDKLEARLGGAMLSIPACKGFEIGRGFGVAEMLGSVHNDAFVSGEDGICCEKNDAGGIIGGISSGELIYFNVAFKPPATIKKAQKTCDIDGVDSVLEGKGRHDPCVVNRAVPIVEAMCGIVILDSIMQQSVRLMNGGVVGKI